jgi:hypothetical protein
MQNMNKRKQGGNNPDQKTGDSGNSKRGLASADKETRERVASEGGKASAEARREGGNSGNNSGGNR